MKRNAEEFVGYKNTHPIYGNFEVIGINNDKVTQDTIFNILFYNTKTIKPYSKQRILQFNIKDDNFPINNIYNRGKEDEFMVIEKLKNRLCLIKFTNFEITTNINMSLLKNEYHPNIYVFKNDEIEYHSLSVREIATFLKVSHQAMYDLIKNKIYVKRKNIITFYYSFDKKVSKDVHEKIMITKIYKEPKYDYGNIVNPKDHFLYSIWIRLMYSKHEKMCDRWKCFQYFTEDVVTLNGYNETNIKVHFRDDNRIRLITKQENLYAKDVCEWTKYNVYPKKSI